MTAEVAGMGTDSSASGATSSAVHARLLLLLPTQRDRQRGGSIASSGGRENKKVTLTKRRCLITSGELLRESNTCWKKSIGKK